ncbi:L,D-transpeptidase [Catenulispora subtropica]|uniref:L,D-TPase catalytic domain-containing protein n=1 Tax=Catenulispora subtropica TaxID=450798 RepID=A0ABN2RYU3_9ACTN
MHDTLDERLAQLGGSLEDAAAVRSPSLVRSRGEQIRAAHRRRMVAMTATGAAVAVIGVGSLVAFRPDSGGHAGPVGPGSTVTPTAPAPTAPSGPPSHTAVGAPPTKAGISTVVVDLKKDTMTVYGKDQKVLKTIPVTGGTATHPTRVGTFTVASKQQHMTLSTTMPQGGDSYSIAIDWVLQLDGGGPQVYAMPWNSSKFGQINGTHGDVGMSTADAEWLYDQLETGDGITIR